MTELTRSAEVTLIQLGQQWEFLAIVEGATTLQEILQGRRIPAGAEIRLNGSLVERSRYSEIKLRPGDVIVAVPMVEGGAAGIRWVRLQHVPREAEAALIKARIPFRRLPHDDGILVPAEAAKAARVLVWRWWTGRHGHAVGATRTPEGTTPAAPGSQSPTPPTDQATPLPPPPTPSDVSTWHYPGWRDDRIRQAWCALLERWAATRGVPLMLVVRVGHASGRYQSTTPEAVNLVLYGTYREPLQTRSFPEEVAFVGRRYRLTLGQRRGLEPSGVGTIILDEAEEVPLAEVVDRTIYVLFRIYDSVSLETFQLMEDLLVRALPLITGS